jgi:hypothetical protein
MVENSRLWTRVAEATRPRQLAPDGRLSALGQVVEAVEAARDAGLESAQMSEVRGLALSALSTGERADTVRALARIYGTALVERAKLEGALLG